MANNFYPCTAISGLTGSVKALHKNDLADGDTAMAILTTGYVHFYRADATSGATEDLPAVVEPGGTGDLRFIEMFCTKLAIQDISETYYASIVSGDTLTANRALTLILGDAARQITLSGNPTLADWFDQSVKTTASPTFAKMYFNTNPTVGDTAEGKMYYDAVQHTLSLNLSDDVNLQIGQETLIRVHNDTGSTITNGSPVYLTGASGIHPTVADALADSEDTYYAVGVATQDIDDGDEGFITRTGKIHDLDTSSYVAGEALYVGPTVAGTFTNVKPSSLAMRVGSVIYSHATDGIIYVNLTPIQSTSSQISAGAAVAFFFDGTEIIGTGNNNDVELETLSKTPSQAAETVETITVNNNTVLNEAYLYNTALDRTSISAGIWKFYNWCGVNSAVGVTEILRNVMRVRTPSGTVTITGTGTSRTATASTGAPFALQVSSVNDDGITDPSGSTIDTTSYIQTPLGVYAISARTSDTVVTITVPTTYTNESAVAYSVHKRLFQVSTGEINNLYGSAPTYTGLQLNTITSAQPAFTIAATDKLSVFRFGKTTRTSDVTIAVAYGGSTRYSYFETPLETLHGNLPGLQGGTGTVPDDEYYHLTSAQHTIATQAATAALNGYATSTQITKLDGIEALADVTDATNVAAAGALMIGTGGTLNANLALGDAKYFTWDEAPASDHTASGDVAVMTAGENLVFGDVCYIKSDGKCWKADADDSATMPGMRMALESISASATGNFLLWGVVRDDSWSWNIGETLYVSGTAGAMTQAVTFTEGQQVQALGIALTATVVKFTPEVDVFEFTEMYATKNTGYTITWAELSSVPKVFACESDSDQTFTFVAPTAADVGKQFWVIKTGAGTGSVIIDAPADVSLDAGTANGTCTSNASERSSILMVVVSATQLQTLAATGTWTWS